MSCQCYQIGGPFIAEDPDCLIHGTARDTRVREADRLLGRSEREDITVEELRAIIDSLHNMVVDLE